MRTAKLLASKARSSKAIEHDIGNDRHALVARCFGGTGVTPSMAAKTTRHVSTLDGSQLPITVQAQDSSAGDRDLLLVSHVEAQANGIRKFLLDADFVQARNISDDASMWIANPNPADKFVDGMGAEDDGVAKRLDKRRKNGRLVMAPVLNHLETLFKLKVLPIVEPCTISVRALEVHSPAQPMPAANYSTVMSRLLRWSVISHNGPGFSVDPQHVISVGPPGGTWTNLSIMKDCLMVNSNIVCRIERGLAAMRAAAPDDADQVSTVWSSNCTGHMCVLCLKPILQFTPGLSSHVVRIGHLCQSSRSADKYRKGLQTVFRESFEFKPCLAYPPEYVQWRAFAQTVIAITFPFDTTPETTDYILTYLNGNWQEAEVMHWCLPGCPCGGVRERAHRSCWTAVLMMADTDCPLALEYRWKHMEAANNYCYRARAVHDLGYRAFASAFPRKEVDDAQADLVAAAAGGRCVQDMTAAKNRVKAGKIQDYMKDDPRAESHLRCLVQQKTLQSYLNTVFKVLESQSRKP